MNREDEFDLLLARWLEEGPFEAPDRPVAAAIEHARAHPRRRFSRSVLWRSVMDSMHLAPVTPRHTNNVGRAFAVALAAIVVAAVAVASGAVLLGRGGGTGAAPGGAVAPAATPSPTPVPTPSPVTVTGTSNCGTQDFGTDTQVGDIEQVRGLVLACQDKMSDPRVTGETTVNGSIDIRADQSADAWGTAAIAGPDGTWTGKWTGLIEKGYTIHRIAVVLKGAGAYEGLQYRYTQTGNAIGSSSDFETAGVIEVIPSFEPTSPVTGTVAATGTEYCTAVAGGTSVDVAGVTQLRSAGVSCTETMSDPRVSGDSTRRFNSDTRADGSSGWWGTGEISNAGGSWLGVWTGTMDPAQNLRITATWVGSGGYAGLQYRVDVVSPANATDLTVTGMIEPIQ